MRFFPLIFVPFLYGCTQSNIKTAQLDYPERIATQVEFRVTEPGGFLLKTIKELGTKEAQAIVILACSLFGHDCSKEAARVAEIARMISRAVGGSGEDHWGHIHSPPGYDICRAQIDFSGGISRESSFSTTIVREPDRNGLAWYIHVPKHRPRGQFVKFVVDLEFVIAPSSPWKGCWPSNSVPWAGKGYNDGDWQFYPGARR